MAKKKRLLLYRTPSTLSTETLRCWSMTCLLQLLPMLLLTLRNQLMEMPRTTRCKLPSMQTLLLMLQNLLLALLKMHSCSDLFKTTMETSPCCNRMLLTIPPIWAICCRPSRLDHQELRSMI